jgi:hypothetical protein
MGGEGGDHSKIIWYRDRFEVLAHAAALAPVEGLILEFGVASGGTIRALAESVALRDRKIFGFDSFKGLSQSWGSYAPGHFACEPPHVPDNVELVIGRFEETLKPFLGKHQGAVALVHLDADLYSSTKFVLDALTLRIIPGTVIELDEYWIVTDHERRAFNEWLTKTGRTCRHEARALEQLLVTMES